MQIAYIFLIFIFFNFNYFSNGESFRVPLQITKDNLGIPLSFCTVNDKNVNELFSGYFPYINSTNANTIYETAEELITKVPIGGDLYSYLVNIQALSLYSMGYIEIAVSNLKPLFSMPTFCIQSMCNYLLMLNYYPNKKLDHFEEIIKMLSGFYPQFKNLNHLPPCMLNIMNILWSVNFNQYISDDKGKGLVNQLGYIIIDYLSISSAQKDTNVFDMDNFIQELVLTNMKTDTSLSKWWAYRRYIKEKFPHSSDPFTNRDIPPLTSEEELKLSYRLINPDIELEFLLATSRLHFSSCINDMSEIPIIRQQYLDDIRFMTQYLKKGHKIIGSDQIHFIITVKYGFSLSYHNLSSKEHLLATEEFYRTFFGYHDTTLPTLQSYRPIFSGTYLLRKIRIGFLSNFLYGHSVGKSTMGVIEQLPRDIFDVIVFTIPIKAGDRDLNAHKIKNASEEFYPIMDAGLSVNDIVSLVRSKMIDIMVFPEIGMHIETYSVALHRVAPIHVATWGHSDTSGIHDMDYYISSKLFEKDLNKVNEVYSENLIAMDSLSAYYFEHQEINEDYSKENLQKVTRTQFYHQINLPTTGKIYFVPSSMWKLLPIYDQFLKKILEVDEQATIVILITDLQLWPCISDRLSNHLGYLMNRVRFIPKLVLSDFLRMMLYADVILDSYPFGICNGAFDAFSLGRGVITYPGDLINGRFVYGFYKKMGIMDLIASSPEDYVKLAIRYAHDDVFRNEIETKIIDLKHLVFKERESIDEWSQHLLLMAQNHPIFIKN